MVIGYHDNASVLRGSNLDLVEIDSYSKNLVRQFDIRTPSVSVTASTLSGGNQQKAIIAREFSRDPRFLLVNQPTRGVDVGAIEYIHRQILDMRNRDVAILLISLELEEIFALSDRILVIYEGRIVRELVPEETSDREVGLYMTGGRDKERA
jgi:simple sugar transport system ATP-binding protein